MGGKCAYGIPRSSDAIRAFHGRYRVEDCGHDTPCWVWTGSITIYGYAQFHADGMQCRALRFAYTHLVGEIPAGLTIDHLCRNKACVNPAHLEAVTRGENSRRMVAAKTHCKRGHPWVESNFLYESGRRYCSICRRAKWAVSNAKKSKRRTQSRLESVRA